MYKSQAVVNILSQMNLVYTLMLVRLIYKYR